MSEPAIQPAWLTLAGAVIYSGLSESTLHLLIKGKHVISSNCKLPGNSKGRRLLKRESLDAFIEAGIDAPPVELAMNRKGGKP